MASAYLTRTKTTPTDAKIFTASVWVKKAGNDTSNGHYIIDSQGGTSGAESTIAFETTQKLRFGEYDNGNIFNTVCDAQFRDVHGWYHVVVAGDSTQATASNRVKIWVNGELQSVANDYPSQNHEFRLCRGSSAHDIGRWQSGTSRYFDGQMAHFHFVDGTAYTPTTFGETDSTTGIWKPKTAPSGITYGNNGFWLKFDNSANMGLDSAGSNNFTTNGTIIQNKDTPSNVFATLNPLARRLTNNAPTYSNTNSSLQGQTVDGQNNNAIATLGDLAKGKYYFECKVGTVGSDFGVGISDTPNPANGIPEGSHEIFYKYDGTKWNGSAYASYGATYTTNDIIGCAFDVTTGTVQFYKNGVSQGTAATDLATNLDNGYTPMGYTNQGLMHFNFGNGYFGTTAVSSAQNPTDGVGIFEYTPPTNYRAVCTKSINAQEYS